MCSNYKYTIYWAFLSFFYYCSDSNEELWSDYIHSSSGSIDLNKAFFSTSKIPHLDLVSFTIDDQNEGNDKDNKPDADETVNLTLKIKNTGSPANVVYAKIRTANDGNSDDITILKDSVNFGSIGVYRSMINDTIPFKIKINKNCNNKSNVSLDVLMLNNADTTVFIQNIKFKIYNGQELSGILLRDTILTPDKNWVISNNLRISTGVTVTILPGTSVEVLAGVDNRGKVIAIGTHEKRIYLKGVFGGDLKLKYVDIDGLGGSLGQNSYDMNRVLENCNITNLYSINAKKISNSKIYNSFDDRNMATSSGIDTLYHCLIENCFFRGGLKVNLLSESTMNNYWNLFTGLQIHESKYNVFNKMINGYVIGWPGNPEIWNKYPTFLFYYNGSSESYTAYGDHGSAMGIGKDKIIKNSLLDNSITSYYLRTDGSADMVTLGDQYWGTNNPTKIKEKYYDFNNNAGIPYFNIEPKLVAPSDSCPGHVWKVLVNGKDAQDELVDPVGVGKQRFDVYFNRAMNKDSIPQVTFGGIYPYTSNKINEDGTWSEDGKIYTVYKTIKLTTGDGINQIRVAGAIQDADWGWDIPVEDSRFSFIISAANSASTEFMATQGLGKVKLEWNSNDLEDGLGYNMYRMEHINDSTLSEPILINSTLITDTLYTDFAVTPNKKYYYYYKILRTNLAETDSSKVVSATPFTASKGDANGDLSVNVLDITTIVAYLLNNNPQPFIFEAADMNSDTKINVLDIVGVVNKILNVPQNAPSIAMTKQVELFLENDTLFANSNTDIGGIQLDIKGISSIDDIQILKSLNEFESGNSLRADSLRLIFYSMSDKNIPAGQRIPLLKLKSGSTILDAIFGETNGSPIKVNYIMTRIPDIQSNMNQTVAELGQNFPNPVNGKTVIPVRIYEPVDEAVLRVINMMGQEVEVIRLSNPYIGEHLLPWNSKANKGLFIYTLDIKSGNHRRICPIKKMIVQ